MGVILKKNQQYALLFSGKKYAGYADKKYLIRSRLDPDKMTLKHVLKHVPKLQLSDDESKMAKLFVTADVRVLPVFDKDKVNGVVHAIDILPSLTSFFKGISIAEAATKKGLLVLSENTPIGYAVNVMKEKNVDRAPVIGTNNKLSGIVSYVDLYSHFHVWPRCQGVHISKAASHQKGKKSGYGIGEKQDLNKQPLSNIMTRLPTCVTCASSLKISEVIKKMVDNNVTSVVLCENQEPIGIITVKDILQEYIKRSAW